MSNMSPKAQHERQAQKILAKRALAEQNKKPSSKDDVNQVKKLAKEANLAAEKEAEEARIAAQNKVKEQLEADAAAENAKRLNEAANATDPYDGLKNKELKKLLDGRTPPVPYPKGAKREELIALLQNN